MTASMRDLDLLRQAGMPQPNPGRKSFLDCVLKDDIRRSLRVLDEQNAINRFTWYNLPSGLTGQMMERILYYKGQAALFYMEDNDTFYFLPYTLNGTIDVYGRFLGITPLPFAGGTIENESGTERPWICGLVKKPVYDLDSIRDENILDHMLDGAVLLKDYSEQVSTTIIPRQTIMDPILGAMAEAFPMARTSLIANSGVKGMRVSDEDQAQQVKMASKNISRAAMSGDPWIPIVGAIEFQDLTNGTALKAEEYLLYMQALDNYRLSLYGLDSGGIFQKKSHMLEGEMEMNQARSKAAYQDGLTKRQHFCDIVNAIWGLGIWCEPSESAIAFDKNMDGAAVDQQDQSGIPGEQPEISEEGEE